MKEYGVIKKEWGGRVPVAIIYPNTYYIGMSNLALHKLYKLMNDDPQIAAERVFRPDEGEARSVESSRRISDFSVAAFTFSFEMDYLNIPKILGPNIPLLINKRTDAHPILIAGGPAVTQNPAALSKIFDCLVVGEAECVIGEIKDAIKSERSKDATISRLSKSPHIWVPGTGETGDVERAWVSSLDDYETRSVIWTDATEFGHMHLVEVSRGCPWMCRFCATPPLYTPYRIRGMDSIMKMIEPGLEYRSCVGLIGSDVLGHPAFREIAYALMGRGTKISLSSLRVNWIDAETATIMAKSGHRRTTLGIEAGTEVLRRKIDKKLTDEDIFSAVKNLSNAGITNLKLYFMIGLPGETDADIEGIARLTAEIRRLILAERSCRTLAPNISVVVTPFVPKKSTPFASAPFAGIEYLQSRLKTLKRFFKKIPNTTISGEPPQASEMEYRLSHTDAETALLLIEEEDCALI